MTAPKNHASKRFIRLGIPLAAVAFGLVNLTGCTQIQQHVGDAWSVTYEVTIDQPTGTPLNAVTIEGAHKRGTAPKTVTIDNASTSKAGNQTGSSVWSRDLIVLAKGPARVRATPRAGASATCRILLDGQRVIQKRTAAPGKTVTCTATTPEFD